MPDRHRAGPAAAAEASVVAEALSVVPEPLTPREARLICDLLRESRTDPEGWTRSERRSVSRLHQIGAATRPEADRVEGSKS